MASELELEVLFAAELDEVVDVLDIVLLVDVVPEDVVFPVDDDFPVLVDDESVVVVLPVPNAPPRALVTLPMILDSESAASFFSC